MGGIAEEDVVCSYIECQRSSYKRWRLQYVIIATRTSEDEIDGIENRENDADVDNLRGESSKASFAFLFIWAHDGDDDVAAKG